jgi:hypothetical protein
VLGCLENGEAASQSVGHRRQAKPARCGLIQIPLESVAVCPQPDHRTILGLDAGVEQRR